MKYVSQNSDRGTQNLQRKVSGGRSCVQPSRCAERQREMEQQAVRVVVWAEETSCNFVIDTMASK
jgi:hypothetical protein